MFRQLDQDAFTELHCHRWFEEDRLIVVNVQQRHLQRLRGVVRHWLAHVTGHDDKLKELLAPLETHLDTSTAQTTRTHTQLTHAVEGLFFSIQFHSRCDDTRHRIDVEVLPVSVTGSGLQEGIADLPVHPLIRVGCMHLIHWQAWRLLLHGRQRELCLKGQLERKHLQTVSGPAGHETRGNNTEMLPHWYSDLIGKQSSSSRRVSCNVKQVQHTSGISQYKASPTLTYPGYQQWHVKRHIEKGVTSEI